MICIAIDGPGGCGKSTVSKIIAEKLGFISVDTGALYRTIAYYFKKNNIDFKNEKLVESSLKNIKLNAKNIEGKFNVFLEEKNVSLEIRSEEISLIASEISKFSGVRNFLLEFQRQFARKNNTVMDGRDIGTVVIPKANVKFFLTASCEERAKRRFFQLKNIDVSYEQILSDLKKRDEQDTTRRISPLKKANDAFLVDNTNLSLKETVQKIYNIIKEKVDLK